MIELVVCRTSGGRPAFGRDGCGVERIDSISVFFSLLNYLNAALLISFWVYYYESTARHFSPFKGCSCFGSAKLCAVSGDMPKWLLPAIDTICRQNYEPQREIRSQGTFWAERCLFSVTRWDMGLAGIVGFGKRGFSCSQCKSAMHVRFEVNLIMRFVGGCHSVIRTE